VGVTLGACIICCAVGASALGSTSAGRRHRPSHSIHWGFIGITLFPAPDVEVDNSWPSHFDSFCFGTVNLDVDGTRAAQRRTNEILL
jgi:hypothetical protein